MNTIESTTRPLLWFMGLLLSALIAGCGGGGNTTENTPLSPNKAITAYMLAGVSGTINESAKTIAVTIPFGTNITALAATFTSTGTNVKVGDTIQASTVNANDFTSPVAYTVTAANATTVVYTVTVSVAANTAKAMTAYSFAGAAGTINEAAKTISVTMPNGTNVTALAATFTSTGTSVKVGAAMQTSDTTPNDFTSPVLYTVTAADSSTATYTVTVSVATPTAKAMTSFSFVGFTGATGTVNESAKTIAVTVPFGTNVTALAATFTSTGINVKVGAAVQTSTATTNNFTSPVLYTVTAADNSTATYTVTVSAAANSAKAMTAFSFAGYTGAAGTINESAKTITVTVPFGTPVTALVATFTTSGAGVNVGATVQTSVATANNFTSPVAYTVTAADSTTATYAVTVSVAASSAKAMTAFSFAGYTGAAGTINEAAKTITVTVPFGTPVTALVATFTTSGAGVNVGATVQTSTATANNFTSPVLYTVTAADNSTATYTVTVSAAANSAKAMTAFSFAGYTGAAGTINESAKTITVTVPFGTPVTALVATFTSSGASVNVGAAVQTSVATANNFTSPVLYMVNAADSSTATYNVTVNVAANSTKAMTAFSFVGYTGAAGTINEAAKTIAVTVPFGTNVTALATTFSSTGINVKVGAAVQTSGATPNNFTSPVAYTVTAADSTTAIYTVTVSVAANSAKAMTAFSFAGYTGAAGTINEAAKTITVTVPFGTPVTALIATFTTTGLTVNVGAAVQTSVATANNFTSPVAYTVTAADSTTAIYAVTVSVAANSAKAMTAFSFAGYTGAAGTINEPAKTITVTVPFGTPVTALVATFTSSGASVNVGAAVQTSTATANNFTSPVAYTVTAVDGTTAIYTVAVSVAANSAKAMTAFSFAGYTGAAGTINEAAKTITVTVPFGTPVTALVATFTTTGATVNVGAAVQTSVATANNFTSPVAYTVTAADATTAIYTVTVTVAAAAGPGVNLGTAGTFVILTKTGITNVPTSAITGDVGVSPIAASAITGMPLTLDVATGAFSTTPQIVGKVYAADYVGGTTSAALTTAVLDMQAAYTDAAGRAPTSAATLNVGAGTLTGLTLAPGVYQWGTAVIIPTNLTLSGTATDVWIFQVAGALDLAAAQSVLLSGGAVPKNVFWQVSGAVTVGTTAHMEGVVLSATSITLQAGASANSRLLAQTAVTLDSNVVTQPAP